MSNIDILRRLTGHNHARITRRGNDAISWALKIAKGRGYGKVLVPDQGGWFTHKSYPGKLGMEVKEIKTDYGVIDAASIDDEKSVILFENPAGYYAHQDIKYIRNKGQLFIIMDVSGCLGDEDMCSAGYADVLVGSFGHWKAVNAGYGGFISSNLEIGEESLYDDDAHIRICLENVKQRLDFLYSRCDMVKKDLKKHEILHPERKGLNVIVKTNEDKEQLLSYCNEKGFEFVICPKEIKVLENAISIEVRRTN